MNVNTVILSFVIGYGIITGVKNLFFHIMCTISSKELNQGTTGQLLDIVFVSSIVYLYLI